VIRADCKHVLPGARSRRSARLCYLDGWTLAAAELVVLRSCRRWSPSAAARGPRSSVMARPGLAGRRRRRIRTMTIQLVNPEGLSPQATYTQVVVATGTTMVFIAGQEPEDADGNSVAPGDLAAQARHVYANLGRALAAAGARPDQVAKITIYVVDYKSEYLPVIERARVELFGEHKPADTLIGVARLARPEFLIEVDAIAVK
jgi:enamine deaminase RidA (YjgF/YER057c/UK114 family)